MTPQQFDLMCLLIEAAVKAAYTVGREDGKSKAPVKTHELLLDAGKRLLLKRELNKKSLKR